MVVVEAGMVGVASCQMSKVFMGALPSWLHTFMGDILRYGLTAALHSELIIISHVYPKGRQSATSWAPTDTIERIIR